MTDSTPAPASCPACGAPEYKDVLDSLFVRGDGALYKKYECGAGLVFHNVPPVRTEVKEICTHAFALSVTLHAELKACRGEVEVHRVERKELADGLEFMIGQRDKAQAAAEVMAERLKIVVCELERASALLAGEGRYDRAIEFLEIVEQQRALDAVKE